jgi:acyl-coenzyme A thioesterase PaaI-like protein
MWLPGGNREEDKALQCISRVTADMTFGALSAKLGESMRPQASNAINPHNLVSAGFIFAMLNHCVTAHLQAFSRERNAVSLHNTESALL